MSRQQINNRSLRRRQPSKLPKRKFVLVSEGTVTEPGYFRSLESTFRSSLVSIETIGKGADPSVVVATAKERLDELMRIARRSGDSNDKNFEVWILVDVDTHTHLKTAIETAKRSGIGAVVSNPCFEIWALYHFVDWNAPVTVDQAIDSLEQHVPNYKRNGKRFVIGFCGIHQDQQRQAVMDACQRSERSIRDRRSEGIEGGCPSSTCHDLVKKLLP